MGLFNMFNNDAIKAHRIEMMRTEVALESADCNIMMANTEHVIVYANQAVHALLKQHEHHLQANLPNFNASQLVGQSIASFFPQPGRSLEAPCEHVIQNGDSCLRLSLKPLFDDEQSLIGTMLEWEDQSAERDQRSILDAMEQSQAVAQYTPDGHLLRANEKFYQLTGYSEDMLQGQSHSLLVPETQRESPEYTAFWTRLRQGKKQEGEYQRRNCQGQSIWTQAVYVPVFDHQQHLTKIVEFCSGITKQKELLTDARGQIEAISKSQAVIEFDPTGTIVGANDNFLTAMGYSLEEICHQHHSMFVDQQEIQGPEYKAFWADLTAGKFRAGEFRRLAKGGREVWIQASYNPIFDANGQVRKVVKYATDITRQKLRSADFQGQLDAISKSQAVIEFDTDGTIITANDNFLQATGYSLEEIKGQHHSMFVEPNYRMSQQYNSFWKDLKAGKFSSGEFKRIAKDGSDIWIQASYNPIFDMNGAVFKVVKYATDITDQKLRNAYYEGQINAISKAQAVIEFDTSGMVQWANDNFLEVTGYTLDEIKGQHHKIFVDKPTRGSDEYAQFWSELANGKFFAGEFKRVSKSGEDIWIQASYNPILDVNGNVFKVVKYATDITAEKRKNAYFAGQLDAIGKSQAVIEFDMDGTILDANDNFLNVTGYTLAEIKGKHHSMFVDTETRNSHEYRAFWEQLNHGVYSSGEYRRFGKNGKEVWIQASYNPIMDQNGRPFRVVKYASDVTARTTAIYDIKHIMAQLTAGDLTCELDHEFEGEFKVLGESINSFIGDLRNTIYQINSAVETINSASAEIATGNIDLSSRTEQQASSLEETASSMEELTGTVRLNAENAEQANSLASQASFIAEEGGGMIQQVVQTMSSINESAQKISDIIGVIDGIAFQTNILALNAAVEAARAGEQGRGFAVVASEVRTLAQRSAEAAKDIKALISDSVSKIASGNTLVNQSGETMGEVVTSIKRVNDIMSEIAAASSEQSSGIDEISKAVSQMDEMTQQNAALVEQAAAAAESMQQQAEQLSDRVATFKLDDKVVALEHETSSSSPKVRLRATGVVTPNALPKANVADVRAAAPQNDHWESF